MKHITERWTSYNSQTDTYSFHPWYLAKGILGGRLVGREFERAGLVPSYLGKAYFRFDMAASVMYPKPLHLIVRLLHWLNYWTYLPEG